MKTRYLILKVYDYKGGELGRPYCFDSLEELLIHIENLWKSFWNSDTREYVYTLGGLKSILDPLEETLDNTYAGGDSGVTAIYSLDRENDMNKITIKYIKENIDWNKLFNLLKEV